MFKHHFTAYLCLKSIICFIGAAVCVALNQSPNTLLIVAGLSFSFAPLMAWLEDKQ